MKELYAAGLIDDETFTPIETSWANAAAAGYGPSIDAGEFELLQRVEAAPGFAPRDLEDRAGLGRNRAGFATASR